MQKISRTTRQRKTRDIYRGTTRPRKTREICRGTTRQTQQRRRRTVARTALSDSAFRCLSRQVSGLAGASWGFFWGFFRPFSAPARQTAKTLIFDDSTALFADFGGSRAPQIEPKGAPKSTKNQPPESLGAAWGLLGALGALLAALGALLAALGRLLGGSWALLGGSWASVGRPRGP